MLLPCIALAPTVAAFFPAVAPTNPAASSRDELALEAIRWGVLTDVHATDPETGASVPVAIDVPLGPGAEASGELVHSGALGTSILTLPHAPGSEALARELAALDAALLPAGGANGVPTNAALVLDFARPIDPDSVAPGAVQLRFAGEPLDARLFAARRPGTGRAWTRVVVDPHVSYVEAELARALDAPRPTGLPATEGSEPLHLILAAELDAASGAWTALRAAGGGTLRGTRDVEVPVYASVAGVADVTAPEVLGIQGGALSNVIGQGGAAFLVDYQFANPGCGQDLAPGDVILTRGHAVLVQSAASTSVGGLSSGASIVVVRGDPATFQAGRAAHLSTWDPLAGDAPDCFVVITPTPSAPPAAGVDPSASVGFRFTEVVAQDSLDPYAGLFVERSGSPLALGVLVPGIAEQAAGGDAAFFSPLAPFDHEGGAAETYLASATSAITDLAGNGLLRDLLDAPFTLDPAAATANSGGSVLTFDGPDQDGDGNPEVRGQLLYDFDAGTVRGRPVSRFSRTADRNQVIPGLMIPFTLGVQTPLNPLGSRLMSVYRYADLGFSASDEAFHNIDVEGLHWSPIGGQVIFDAFDEFEIRLAHARRLPDEAVHPVALLPLLPNSGLVGNTFADNVLDPGGSSVVHARQLGYVVNPLDQHVTALGTPLVPYPLNTDGDAGDDTFYTWRDTALTELGGEGGRGIDPEISVDAGLAQSAGAIAGAGVVPSFGLPLLTEIRCFPDDTALGLNPLDISIAINSSSRPNFRVFSSGGFDVAGTPVVVDPDLSAVPSGGFNPLSVPPGKATPPSDNSFYIGQVDFVVRVSRAHTIWLDSGTDDPDWVTAQLLFEGGAPPAGSSVELAYRGADSVGAVGGTSPAADASLLDPYGDEGDPFGVGLPGDPANKNPSVAFFHDDASWFSDLDDLDGARFVQVRITFASDPATGAEARLDSLALVHQD